MVIDLKYLEIELQKRWKYPYQWGQKQNDFWDDLTNFIYKTNSWEDLVSYMKSTSEIYKLDKKKVFQYAANRWYNFWSAIAVENIFTTMEGVTPALNSKNRLVDFSIFGIDFDHKTSVFPKKFNKSISYSQSHKRELIFWLYKNQSQQKRKHLKNRLFIVVYDQQGEHWKMKACLNDLKVIIQQYVQNFNPGQLEKFEFEKGETCVSDIIWALK